MLTEIVQPLRAIPPTAPVRRIGTTDLNDALRKGLADYRAKRGDVILIGILYPLVTIVMTMAFAGLVPVASVAPFLAGLVLLGPLVSAGFYELARRRAAGADDGWRHFLSVRHAANFNELLFMGAILIGIFAAWMISALIIHNLLIGDESSRELVAFVTHVLTTPQGWAMIGIGILVGFGFAVLALAASFVSMPMLVDRDVGFGRALRTSIKAFRANPGVTIGWGIRVVALLILGAIPLLIGLAMVLPVLGYATYHLYTMVVDRTALPPAVRRP